VATRVKWAAMAFVAEFVEQLGDMLTDFLTWFDVLVNSPVQVVDPATKPGQSFLTFMSGLVLLKYANPWQ
jgi:hypothetical protein